MTLYRQLIIFTCFLFFVLFAGTWYAKLQTTRNFLLDQLESHAQDTATSLGLSITQHMLDRDMIMIESMVSAVFDRGYYMTIRLSDIHGHVLIDRTQEVMLLNVPAWFIQFVELETPEVDALVMAGWNQAGSVFVKSHPGYAYLTLWNDVVATTLWFLTCGVFVLIFGGVGLRLLLKPLTMIERQADALCKKEYEIQEHIPRTREFKRVVEAMNRMTLKVKEMFEEQVMQAESLRLRAYTDPVTGLGSRRYFDSQVTARLERRDELAKGLLLLVKLSELERLNMEKGFQAGDDFLKRVAEVLQGITSGYPSCVLARLTGGDFGIFLPDVPSWDAEVLAKRVAAALSGLAAEKMSVTDNIGHVGVASYAASVTLSRMLSEADLALSMARQSGPNSWSVRTITTESDAMPLGRQQWKQILEKALVDRRFRLDAQPVVMASDRSRFLHLEVYSRVLLEDGRLLNAGIFTPLAEQLNLIFSIDRAAIEEVFRINRSHLPVQSVAVNMSVASLRDNSFLEWLKQALNDLPASAPRVIFEFSEFGVVQNLELIKEFSLLVRGHGHAVGLDHYGQSFSNLGYLKSLRPEYVKIDPGYTGELKEKDSDSRFFIGSLCSVAHSIDIMVIGERVETEQQVQILGELNVDAIQGYVVAPPRPIQEMQRS